MNHPLVNALYRGLKKSNPKIPNGLARKLAYKKYNQIMKGESSPLKYAVGNKVAERFASSDLVYNKLEVR